MVENNSDCTDYIDSISIEYNSLIKNINIGINLNNLYEYFKITIGENINKSLNLQKQFNSNIAYVVDKNIVKEFIDKTYTYSCPKILKLNITSQHCFIFYVITNFLFKYNNDILKLDGSVFLNNVYYNNIINICSKFLVQSRRFYQRLIKKNYLELYSEVKINNNVNWIKYFDNNDDKLIKNDILYLFLINIIHRYDPMLIDDVEFFLNVTFKRLFYFYLKSKIDLDNNSTNNINKKYTYSENILLNNNSDRYRIYEHALQMSNMQLLCNNSNYINKLNSQIENIKNLIIPNELQKLYVYISNSNNLNLTSEKVLLFKIYELIEDIEKFKKEMPLIYQLLKSIHIQSENNTFNNIDIKNIKECVYRILYKKFNGVINDSMLLVVIDGISNNLSKSFGQGEFIDMFTMTPLNLSSSTFIYQLELFLMLAFDKLYERE